MLKLIKPLIVLWAALLATHPIQAQTFFTANVNVHNGLPSNNITCLCQTPSGTFWIGSNKGITKWGQEFETYNTENGLPSNNISSIAAQEANILWIGTSDRGLSLMTDGKFTNYDAANGLVNDQVTALHQSASKKVLLVGTAKGLSVYNGKKFTNFGSSFNIGQITGFLENDSAVLIATKNSGVHYFHFAKNSVFRFSKSARLNEESIHAWFVTHKGDTLVSCRNKTLKTLSKNSMTQLECEKQIVAFTSSNNQTWAIARSISNSSNTGLFIVQNDKLVSFNQHLSMYQSNLTTLATDKADGALIVGTSNKGLHIWPGLTFLRLETTPQFGTLRDICEDNAGNIWVLGNNLSKLTQNIYHSFNYNNIEEAQESFIPITSETPLRFSNHKKNIFLGNKNSIHKVDNTHNSLTDWFEQKNDTISFFKVFDNWFITKSKQRINIYKTDDKTMKASFPYASGLKNVIQAGPVFWLLDNEKHLSYIDTLHFVIQKAKNEWPSLPPSINKIESDNNGNLIVVDDIGDIWLFNYTPKLTLNKTKHITCTQYMGNHIMWLLCDKNNQLWMGTDLGLSMVNIDLLWASDEVEIKNWGKGEGYVSTESFKAIESKNGEIWVLSEDRITRFDTQTIQQINRQPSLRISHVTVSGYSSINDPIEKTSAWDYDNQPSFKADNNSLVFSFDVTNLLNKDRVLYQYRLMPGNTEWSMQTKQSFVFLSDLQPGNYTLNVKAWFQHAPNNPSELNLNFNIKQPWYKTVYANVGYATLLILVLVFLFEWRLKQVKSQEAEKTTNSEKMALLKMEALQAQMNPHFIFNALNSLQYNILENNTENSLEFIGEFSKLIRSTLDNASQHFISLKDELDYIENYMKVEQMRYSQKFYYSISVMEEMDTETLYVPPMIIQPHIENAIKYAFASSIGYIIISISKVQDKLICMVEDNGIGRKQSLMRKKTHKSKGQSITSQRFDMLNRYYKKDNEYRYEIEDLHDEEGNASGTRVTLYFPLIGHDEAILASINH